MKAALSGLMAWAVQRATALLALGFLLYFVLHLLIAPPASQHAWRTWVATPSVKVGLLLFFAAVALHAWVGMRDVILDYVKPFGVRLAALVGLAAGLTGTVLWAVAVLAPLS
jgi:succinate dehydrogenase / fumarate reductase membrane anchor subunit